MWLTHFEVEHNEFTKKGKKDMEGKKKKKKKESCSFCRPWRSGEGIKRGWDIQKKSWDINENKRGGGNWECEHEEKTSATGEENRRTKK
jgi:hypothetical protein